MVEDVPAPSQVTSVVTCLIDVIPGRNAETLGSVLVQWCLFLDATYSLGAQSRL